MRVGVFPLLLLLVASSLILPTVRGMEVDLEADVYRVIDGDTFDAFPSGRVRLADVNAPEVGEDGYYEAKEALTSLILDREVYLDVDDIYVMDRYNRLVCVVYIRYNTTHLLNVNMWLLLNGYVELDDYPNEFNPYTWKLYVYDPLNSIKIYVNRGWNLISLPAAPINSSIKAIFAENITKIKYIFTYVNGSWYYWIRGVSSNLKEMHPELGYWIMADESFTQRVYISERK